MHQSDKSIICVHMVTHYTELLYDLPWVYALPTFIFDSTWVSCLLIHVGYSFYHQVADNKQWFSTNTPFMQIIS